MEAFCYDRKGNLLSHAENSYVRTHPIQAYFAKKVGLASKVYLHAEIAAIIRAGDKKIHTLHVFRRNKEGKLLNAKPCPICYSAMIAYGVNKCYYSGHNGNIECLEIKE